MSSVGHTSNLIRNRRDATVAVVLTAIIAALVLNTTLRPMRPSSPWVFDRLYGLPDVRPLRVGLSLFYWAFVLWIVFWFYRAARGKYERFLMASFAVGFVLSVVERFMPRLIAVNMQFLSAAAALVSFVAAIAVLLMLPTKTSSPEP